MTVALNDLFRVSAVGECFSQRIMFTMDYQVITVGTSTVEATVSVDLMDAVQGGGGADLLETDYLALLPPDYTLVYWQAQKLFPTRYAYVKGSRGVAGAHANATETANQAAIITLRTVLAGRQDISNKHIGPIPQGAGVQTNGLLDAAYKTKLGTFATSLLSIVTGPVTGTQWQPVVIHKSPAGTSTVLRTQIVGDTVNTMRRRTVGRGI